MNRKILLLTFVLLIFGSVAFGQEILRIGGLNEATYIYRTAPDSLNSYFRNSFGFNLAYKNFGYGMKFIAELPKYSTSQSELLDDIDAAKLKMGWQEIYAFYQKDNYLVHAGTINETFGSGLTFRSWEDIEFDQDNRIDGFLVRYDGDLRFKALYGGVPSRYDAEKYDLVYGADAEYPLLEMLRLGANAISQRNYSYRNPLTMKDVYDQRDILSARATLNIFDLEISGEYAASELYYPNMGDKTKGSALYTHGSYYFHPIQVGAAYKKYDAFSFRLHDIPLANYHGETLADNQSSGIDEEGLYGWLSWEMTDAISFRTHYAEAWNQDNSKKMNDFFTGLDWTVGNTLIGLEYAQIEKVDDTSSTWQIDQTPALHLGFQAMGRPLAVKLEYAYVERQLYNVSKYHYEPSLQADLAIGKLAVSLGAKTEWKSPADMDKAVYATNMELKYPIFEHTDLTVFAGKDAGGKVCRNGICRYVAPFQGIRAELTTRF